MRTLKNLATLLAVFVFISDSFSQAVVPPNIRASNTLDNLYDFQGIMNSDLLYGIPLPPGKTVGDTYLETHWNNGTVLLYDDKLIEGFPIRYDIRADEVEFKSKKGIKVLKGNLIKSFVWVDSLTRKPDYFVNAKDFVGEDNVPYSGFFQVVAEGHLSLLQKTRIDVKKADYNVQFNVGSHDDKILKKSEFYTLKDKQVVDLPSSKKKVIGFFGDKSEEMEKFIKENALSTTKGEQLKIIFDHYNSLVNN